MTTACAEMPSTTAPAIPSGLSILVVEDDADSAISLAVLLRLMGHKVQTTSNGIDGLKSALADEPDVVLLDIGLPGMTGYEVARQISRHRPIKAPFLVAITGYGQ